MLRQSSPPFFCSLTFVICSFPQKPQLIQITAHPIRLADLQPIRKREQTFSQPLLQNGQSWCTLAVLALERLQISSYGRSPCKQNHYDLSGILQQ